MCFKDVIYPQRFLYYDQFKQWGSVTHQMAVPVPSIRCCVLNNHNLFYQIQNALAFNRGYVLPCSAMFTVASFPLTKFNVFFHPDKSCSTNCSGNGLCDGSRGQCVCNAGFYGDVCQCEVLAFFNVSLVYFPQSWVVNF